MTTTRQPNQARSGTGENTRDEIAERLALMAAWMISLGVTGWAVGEAIQQTGRDKLAMRASNADKIITDNLAARKPVEFLLGGEAIISLGNGKRVKITAPIMAPNGAVVERNRGKDADKDAVTAYVVGDNRVDSIELLLDGHPITTEQAHASSSLVTPDTNSAGDFVVPEGVPGAGEVVAMGVPERIRTIYTVDK